MFGLPKDLLTQTVKHHRNKLAKQNKSMWWYKDEDSWQLLRALKNRATENQWLNHEGFSHKHSTGPPALWERLRWGLNWVWDLTNCHATEGKSEVVNSGLDKSGNWILCTLVILYLVNFANFLPSICHFLPFFWSFHIFANYFEPALIALLRSCDLHCWFWQDVVNLSRGVKNVFLDN